MAKTYIHDVLEDLPAKPKRISARVLMLLYAVLAGIAIGLLVCNEAHAEDQKPYIGWLMVMWSDGDTSQKYVPIKAYKNYDVCRGTIPTMVLSLRIPKGAKVDCIDKRYQASQ